MLLTEALFAGNHMKPLVIQSKIKPFSVFFTDTFDFIDSFLSIPHYVVIVGSVVYSIYKESIFNKFPKEKLIVIPLDEKRKTLDTVMHIYKKLLSFSAKKNLTIISFGGGINQDVVGFTASTLYRGIEWIYVPTTVLAQADSAIGLKTSINFSSYKNVVGTFYPPSSIYINPHFLKTLKKQDYYSGIGEIIKFLLMQKDAVKKIDASVSDIERLRSFESVDFVTNMIKKSIEIKLSYMAGDEFDKGRRNLLNYGHELGHALESSSSFHIPHGIAITIGMIFANLVSHNRKWIDKKLFDEINSKLLLPNIPDKKLLKKQYFSYTSLLKNMKKDKKRISEKLVLVLPQKDFSLIKITDLTDEEYKKNLDQLRKIIFTA